MQYGPLGRSQEDDYALRLSACATLANHIVWHQHGLIFCPAVQVLLDNGWINTTATTMVYRMYGTAYQQGLAAVGWYR